MDKDKIFFQMVRCCEPKITGNATDAMQVEMDIQSDKHFSNSQEQQQFQQYVASIKKASEMVEETKNIPYPHKLTELIFYTVKKNIKRTDIVNHHIYGSGLAFSDTLLLSEKAFDVLIKFNLPSCSVMPCRVVSTKDNTEWGRYYLLQFPMTSKSLINYSKSAFWSFKGEQFPQVQNEQEYYKAVLGGARRHICITEILPWDFVIIQGKGEYVSEKLYDALMTAEISGLECSNSKLFFEGNENPAYQFTYPSVFSIDAWRSSKSVEVWLNKGYGNSEKSFCFGELSRLPNNTKHEIYSAGLGVDRVGYVDNLLAYIDMFPSDDYSVVFNDFEKEVFSDETLGYLKSNEVWIETKNKVHIYFPELCLVYSCFQKGKDARGKRVTIFSDKAREFIEAEKLKI